MSYLSVSEEGYLIAEKSITAQDKEIARAYREAMKEIDDLLAIQYGKLSDVDPADYYGALVKYDRLDKLKDSITEAYKTATKSTKSSIQTGLTAGMTENYNRQMYLTSLVSGMPALPINQDALKYAVTGSIDIWKKIQTDTFKKVWGSPNNYRPQAGTLTQLLNKNYTKDLDRILQTVENGFITGKSYRKQAKAISEIIGKYTTKGSSGSIANALRISRSEGQRVLNAGSLANAYHAQSEGIDVKKMWDAILDSKTRASHQALDGQIKELDEPFVSPVTGASGQAPGQMDQAGDNINCRCSSTTLVNGVPPTARVAIVDGERKVISYQKYSDWAA